MRRLTLIITLIFIFAFASLVHAQEDTYELPAIAEGDIVEGSFEDNITTQLYAFYGTEGDIVSITMTQDSPDLDPFLVLLSAEGEVLAYDDDSGAVQFSSAISNVTLENDGVYFVIATSFLFVDGTEISTDETLDYTLTVTGHTNPEDVEDTDIISIEIEPLAIGDSVEGESTEDNPAVFFFLDGTEGDSLTISLEDANFFTVLHVFDPDGGRIAVDASLAQLELEEDGTYVIMATAPFFYQAIDEDGFFEGGTFVLVIE